MKISLSRSIFYLTTWGYLLVNITIAWVPQLNLPLMALRESWILLLTIYLVQQKCFLSLYVIIFLAIFGLIPILFDFSMGIQLISYVYGFRDVFLIILIVELTVRSKPFSIRKSEIYFFIYFVMALSLLDIVITNILGMSYVHDIFRVDDYYLNKGVEINLSNGFLGDRVGAPLYSPNLLCTLLALFFFFDRRLLVRGFWIKFLSLLICFFTMTKVIIVALGFQLLGSRWKFVVILSLLSIYPLYIAIDLIYRSLDMGLMKYHLASTLGHLHAFVYTIEEGLFSFIPEGFGSNSIMMKVALGIEGEGIESTILARLSELKMYFSILFFYILHSLYRCEFDLERKFIVFVFIIMLLTATSNQPVAYVPFIFLLSIVKNEKFRI
ncbi:MAG: hypothetical protein ACJA2G_001194 [Cognaticolwellia sp.]